MKTLNSLKCKDQNGSNPFLDYIATNSSKMQDMTNEMGVVLYPPQVLNNMRLGMSELANTCTSYLENLLALVHLELDTTNTDIDLNNNKQIIEQLLETSTSLLNRLLNETDAFKVD